MAGVQLRCYLVDAKEVKPLNFEVLVARDFLKTTKTVEAQKIWNNIRDELLKPSSPKIKQFQGVKYYAVKANINSILIFAMGQNKKDILTQIYFEEIKNENKEETPVETKSTNPLFSKFDKIIAEKKYDGKLDKEESLKFFKYLLQKSFGKEVSQGINATNYENVNMDMLKVVSNNKYLLEVTQFTKDTIKNTIGELKNLKSEEFINQINSFKNVSENDLVSIFEEV